MYSSTSYIVTSIVGLESVNDFEAAVVFSPGDRTESREALRWPPNHCGKPWRKLKPPGGSLSRSVALTVLVSEVLVVYVYVVKGVRSGWKMSDENVINGAEDGNEDGNDI
jgi:hypothetical protein